jgi:hypothetical protein
MCCNWSKVNSLKKSKPKKFKVRCCYITASTVLECTCCRILRYVAAPKDRCVEGVTLQTLLGTKKLATFTWGGGASLSQAKPNLKDVLLFALWRLHGRGGGAYTGAYMCMFPLCVVGKKSRAVPGTKDFTIILLWGSLLFFSCTIG